MFFSIYSLSAGRGGGKKEGCGRGGPPGGGGGVLLLENEGYQVQAVTEFTEVVAQVRSFGANLVLLDLGLPGRDGFSLCADLRKTCGVPIILVTSRNSTMDELRALSLGGG